MCMYKTQLFTCSNIPNFFRSSRVDDKLGAIDQFSQNTIITRTLHQLPLDPDQWQNTFYYVPGYDTRQILLWPVLKL